MSKHGILEERRESKLQRDTRRFEIRFQHSGTVIGKEKDELKGHVKETNKGPVKELNGRPLSKCHHLSMSHEENIGNFWKNCCYQFYYHYFILLFIHFYNPQKIGCRIIHAYRRPQIKESH